MIEKKTYIDYVCRSYGMARDLSRCVIANVDIKDSKGKWYKWTHCEWFNFEMPTNFLYTWLKDVEPEVKDIPISLTVKLNDNSTKIIQNNQNTLLKMICASHIMEIECTNS